MAEKPNPSISILKKDPYFSLLIKKHGIPVQESPKNIFQALVRAIIYQQVSGKAAATIFQRFIDLFETKRGKKFPTPEQVVAMPTEKLRSAGLSGQKASYVHDLAQKYIDGTIKHRSLHKMPSGELVTHLTQVKGVGVWTVQMLLMKLGRPDILPTGDLGIQKGFQIVYKLKTLPTHDTMERLAIPWRAHASTASWYLWRAADDAKLISRRYTKKQ